MVLSIKSLLLFVLLLMGYVLPLSSCRGRENAAIQPEAEKPYLLRSQKLGEYTPEQISGRFSKLPQVGLLTQYPVRVYKLVYRTTYTDGREVEASGALLVPVAGRLLPVLSQQHGTIESDHSAPSNYASGSEVWSFGTVLASTGYVVAAPDYLGYGASKHLPHPYQHAPSLATAGVDMLRAAREFCRKNNIALNEQLFLAGYSEGGFATMALHQRLEQKHVAEFTVTASAPGAGAYHTTAFARHILSSDKPLNFINTYLWVLETYNRVYKLGRDFSHYLSEPYASQMKGGSRGVSSSVSPKKLFRDSFLQAVQNGTDKAFLNALRDNDLHNWAPKAPVALFHGTADDYVPFFNSEDAYKAMQAKGATQVELRPIEGGNHFSSVPQYSLGLFLWFASFQKEPAGNSEAK